MFHTNDDTGMQLILSGSTLGQPDAHTVFSNYVFCLPFKLLYTLFPNVSWWLYGQILVMGIALYSCALSYFRLMAHMYARVPIFIIILIELFLLGLFALPLAEPSFTITPAILGGAACLSRVSRWNMESSLRDDIAEALMLIVSYCYRNASGLVVIIFYFIACLGDVLLCREQGMTFNASLVLRWIGALVIAGIFIIVVQVVHIASYSSAEWTSFQQINQARALYIDYRHPTYGDDPLLYEHIGWSRELQLLSKRWFFMDERVTEEAFTEVSEHAVDVEVFSPVQAALRAGFFIHSLAYAGCAGGLLLTSVCLLAGRRRTRLMALATAIIGIALLGYLDYSGRAPTRAVLVVVIPALLLASGMACRAMLDFYDLSEHEGLHRRPSVSWDNCVHAVGLVLMLAIGFQISISFDTAWRLLAALSIALIFVRSYHFDNIRRAIEKLRLTICLVGIIICSLLLVVSGGQVLHDAIVRSQAEIEDDDEPIINYMSENSSLAFVCAPYELSLRNPAITMLPSNLCFWGSWDYYMPGSRQQQLLEGMVGPYEKLFLEDDVRVIVSKDEDRELLVALVGEACDTSIVCKCVDTIDGDVGVYKLMSADANSMA